MRPTNIYEFLYRLFENEVGEYSWFLQIAFISLWSVITVATVYLIWEEKKEKGGAMNHGGK